eukprot:7426888-Lingulodinium_polyedra.AAC.1
MGPVKGVSDRALQLRSQDPAPPPIVCAVPRALVKSPSPGLSGALVAAVERKFWQGFGEVPWIFAHRRLAPRKVCRSPTIPPGGSNVATAVEED